MNAPAALLALALSLAGTPALADAPPTPPARTQSHSTGGEPDRPALTLELDIDAAELSVAERLTLSLRLRSPVGSVPTLNLPKPGETFGGFTVADVVRSPARLADDGRRELGVRVVLEPFLPGERTLPSISATLGEARVRSDEVTVRVRSVLDPKADPREAASLAPPKPPLDLAPPRSIAPIIAAGAVGVFTLAALAGFVVARRLGARTPAPVDPIAAAKSDLAAARAEGALSAASFVDRAVLGRGARALRAYAAARFGEAAIEQTPEELAGAARGPAPAGGPAGSLSGERLAELAAILSELDAHRFAATGAPADAARAALDRAGVWVAAVERSMRESAA
jgi:hypothetical protein